jgi:hypothetical protein
MLVAYTLGAREVHDIAEIKSPSSRGIVLNITTPRFASYVGVTAPALLSLKSMGTGYAVFWCFVELAILDARAPIVYSERAYAWVRQHYKRN